MSSDETPPLKGYWPVAYAVAGSLDEPVLMPMNYSMSVLAGDEYRVPVALPEDASHAAYVTSLLDQHGRASMGVAAGAGPVAAILSIPDFTDRPLIVGDEAAKALADLSATARVCITLDEIRAGAREVMPDRDPADGAPEIGGDALDQARGLAFSVFWAIGDGVTPTRRRKAMIAAGWPESVIEWIAQPQPASEPAPA